MFLGDELVKLSPKLPIKFSFSQSESHDRYSYWTEFFGYLLWA